MTKQVRAIAIGTALQILMVVVGHVWPELQQLGLFPIGGTVIGVLTGLLAGSTGTIAHVATMGALAGGIAGVVGSLVSSALGDVPISNFVIAGASTVVAGAVGALIRRKVGNSAVSGA
jgi:hypothetical protein